VCNGATEDRVRDKPRARCAWSHDAVWRDGAVCVGQVQISRGCGLCGCLPCSVRQSAQPMDGFAASFVVQHFCAARRASATVRVRHSDVQISPVGFWIEPLSQSRNGVAAAGCSPVCSLLCVRENGWGGGARARAVCGETAFIGRAQGRRCPDSMSANSVLHVLHRAVAIFCAFLDDQGMG
jgi:hypothetical protein